jgi:hypothetical protein
LLNGLEDDILPYLLNDTLLFVTQKTKFGTFSPWCFEEPEATPGKKSDPDFESTICYDRLWEAFRIYPEEWTEILKFISLDGPFKDKFEFWMSSYHFALLSFKECEHVFGSAQNDYGIDWVIRNSHQRLQELGQHLLSAGLGIKTNLSLRMSC